MRRLAAIGAVFFVVVVLGVAQLVLPRVAEQKLRDRLEQSGQVLEVQVSAFPAIELLWHQADNVVIRLGRYHSRPGHLASLLAEAGDVGSLTASAAELDTGLLTLHNATLRKNGDQLIGSALVTEADIRRALPILQSVKPVASGNDTLTVQGTASLFGLSASVDATVGARNGALVVAPDVPFGGLATITVFSNPHVEVQSIAATPTASGFAVRAAARLH
jgi:hypothetical protein